MKFKPFHLILFSYPLIGRDVSAYRIRDGVWTKIVKRSAQLPQVSTEFLVILLQSAVVS